VAAAFFWSVINLFQRRFASGELYPEFSTMRTDRAGAKLLYDSLGKLTGITVERNFLPMDFLPHDGVTLVLLGVHPMRVNWNDGLLLRSVERVAGRGNRVVLAMHLDLEKSRVKQEEFERREEPKSRGSRKQSKTEQAPLSIMWKVRIAFDPDEKHAHRLYFAEAGEWKIRDQAGTRILAIERDFDKGSVVLMTESGDFINASAVGLNRLRQVAGALGAYRRIVFDEQHLGIAESGSVVGMARQFRLMGLALGLAICAALFIWRNASSFPPPASTAAIERFSGRTSHAGLLTLLKRHIPSAELAGICWREWLSTNRHQLAPEIRERAEAIVTGSAGRPVEATREIQALLHAKGEL
jgi:hypothetical protein